MSNGQPEAGVTVTWQSTGTAGSLNPANGTTGSDGTASATWTLPREAGNHSATATLKIHQPGTLYATALCNIHGLWENSKAVTVS